MTKALRLALIMLLGLAFVFMIESCRSRSRSVNIGGSAPKINVTLVNLDDTYQNEPTLGYRIACGGSEFVSGKFVKEDKIEFMVKTLKVKDLCLVSVLHLSPPTNIKFIKESGMLYESDKFAVGANAIGQLEGTAILGPLFQYETKGVEFTVPVQFKDKLPEDHSELRASVACEPSLEGVSEKMSEFSSKEKTGRFLFKGGVVPKKKYKCGSMFVRGPSGFGFFGDFKEEFVLNSGDHKTAKIVVLETIPQTPSGVTVITESAGSCQEDEIFDLQTRTCIKK